MKDIKLIENELSRAANEVMAATMNLMAALVAYQNSDQVTEQQMDAVLFAASEVKETANLLALKRATYVLRQLADQTLPSPPVNTKASS